MRFCSEYVPTTRCIKCLDTSGVAGRVSASCGLRVVARAAWMELTETSEIQHGATTKPYNKLNTGWDERIDWHRARTLFI